MHEKEKFIKVKKKLIQLISVLKVKIKELKTLNELDSIRIKYLGKKSFLYSQLHSLDKISSVYRPKIGKIINRIKNKLYNIIEEKKISINCIINNKLIKEKIDVSLPGNIIKNGRLHPISQSIKKIKKIFIKLGFIPIEGLEIENKFYNFTALNISKYHPAYDEKDTFWFDDTRLLRTQTSGMQIRILQKSNPPIRIISSGKVYRKDYDKTHTPMFHQTEGLVVDDNINFCDLKMIIYEFLNSFFDKKIIMRFRNSYFPFTEPSAEVDIKNKKGQWIEVLGCGLVHPNILKENIKNFSKKNYSGYAFGIGIERITALLYDIVDIRDFFKNNLRFLKQFK